MPTHPVSRRQVLHTTAAATALLGATELLAQDKPVVQNGRLKQSVCKWCFGRLSVDELAQQAKKIGLVGIDLLTPADFPTLKQHGLICTMVMSHGINPGLNRVEHHAMCLGKIRDAIEAVAREDWPVKNVICFSGNRAGLDDETGLKTCAAALKQVVGLAEEKKVTISMELLNSKLNHKDYQCDRSDWGVALVKAVGSERFKLLYDIYHMQVQEGDVIATIKKYKDYFAHYHTAGVPGRNEIDDSQELNYVAISKAIVDSGFQGYFAHEFIPRRPEGLVSLAQAAKICDV